MICNKVTYGGQVILTVYHLGFDNEIMERNLKKVEKVGPYNLIFTESVVSDDLKENIVGWVRKEEGFLGPDSSKNPYSLGSCAYIEPYYYIIKPNKLFKFVDNKYVMNMPIERLMLINEFVKKYTGLDVEKNPMLYGDTLVYRSYSRSYHAKKEEGIIIEKPLLGSTVIVKFKKNEAIVSTKVVYIDTETEETEIISDSPWTYHDIEIYFNNQLIYFDKDVSYIRHMQLNMRLNEQGRRIKLNKIADSLVLNNKDSGHISHIGKPLDDHEEIINNSNSEIGNMLKAEQPDDRVMLIKPGELKRAVDVIGNEMQLASDTIWIFDSYFTDINDINGMLDWIRILANCRAKSKNVVFYCKGPNNALSWDEQQNKLMEIICQQLPKVCIRRLRRYLVNNDRKLMYSKLDEMIRFHIYLEDKRQHDIISGIIKVIDLADK